MRPLLRTPRDRCLRRTANGWFAAAVLLSGRSGEAAEPTADRPAGQISAPNPRYTGVLPNQEWAADDTGGQTQNFSVVQAPATGYVYFGNQAGVLEYDGARWRMLPWLKDRGSTPVMRGVVVDELGHIWAGTENEVVRYSPDAAGRWVPESMVDRLPVSERSPGIVGRLLWRDGVVWGASAERVLSFDTQGNGARSWPLENGLVLRGIVDDVPWFFRPGGTLMRLHGDTLAPAPVPALPAAALPLLAVRRTSTGVLEAECARGVLELRGDEWVDTAVALSQALRAEGGATTVVRRPEGGRIFGGDAGWLLLVDAAGNVQARLGAEQGIKFRGLHRTWLDGDGGLWIAGTAGIWRVQMDAAVARHGGLQGLFGGAVNFARDGNELWIVTDQGWFSRDPRSGQFTRHIAANDLYNMLRDPADGWLLGGGPAQPLRTWSERGETRVPIASGGVVDFARDPHEPTRVFAGSQNAVHVLRRGPDGWKREANLAGMSGTMAFVATDSAGAVWASATTSNGLWRATAPEGDWTRAKVERMDGGAAAARFPEGRWRVTNVEGEIVFSGAHGLWRISPVDGRIEPDGRFAGLPDGAQTPAGRPALGVRLGVIYILGIQAQSGRGWRGVRAERNEPWTFTELPLYDFKAKKLVRAASEAADGRTLWIGTDRDLLSLDLAVTPAEYPTPLARWRRVGALEGGEIYYGGARPAVALTLPPNVRAVRLEFAAAALRASIDGQTGIEYRTRASGVDRDWSSWNKATMRELTNLPPGGVTLELQARNYRSVEGPVALLALEVPPFWWETWWFRVGGVLAGALVLAAVVRAVVRRQYQQRIALLEAQAAVQQERLRIARDMHDDLGSTLASIVHLSERKAGSDTSSDAALARIHVASRELVNATHDIVWAATPHHDSLESLVEQLTTHAERTLGDRGVRVVTELPADLPVEPIGAALRHGLFLAFKEAVNNAAKYAQARTATLRVELTPDEIAVTISDDGVGFDEGEVQGSGHGLGNLRDRLAALGGSAVVTSAAGHGTTVVLKLPRQRGA